MKKRVRNILSVNHILPLQKSKYSWVVAILWVMMHHCKALTDFLSFIIQFRPGWVTRHRRVWITITEEWLLLNCDLNHSVIQLLIRYQHKPAFPTQKAPRKWLLQSLNLCLQLFLCRIVNQYHYLSRCQIVIQHQIVYPFHRCSNLNRYLLLSLICRMIQRSQPQHRQALRYQHQRQPFRNQ